MVGWLAGEREAEGEGEGEGGEERRSGSVASFLGNNCFRKPALPPHVAYASKNVLAFEEWAIQARKCPQGRHIVIPMILWGDGGHEVVALCVYRSLGGPFFECQHVF